MVIGEEREEGEEGNRESTMLTGFTVSKAASTEDIAVVV